MNEGKSILMTMADKYGTNANALAATLKNTVFAAAKTEAEFMSLCIVANKYGLDPVTKEIYAFPAKGGGIVPIVGVDGYMKLMNANPAFDGIDFEYAEKTVPVPGGRAACPEWIEARIHRKDRSRPVVIREFFEECFRSTDPWKTSPRRMLRHRALCQCVRVAFGFSGVYDEDEGASISAMQMQVPAQEVKQNADINAMLDASPAVEEAQIVEPAPVAEEAKPEPAPAPAPEKKVVAQQKAAPGTAPLQPGEFYCPMNGEPTEEADCADCPNRASCPKWTAPVSE